MNDLEKQLHSWTLRRPSVKLEQLLFSPAKALAAATNATPFAANPSPAFRFGWLAPATVALMLMGVFFNQRNFQVALSASGKSAAMVAGALSNQSAAAWLPGSFAAEQNCIPAETLEWTNGSAPQPRLDPISTHRED